MTGLHLDPSFEERLWYLARGVHDTELEQHVAVCGQCQDELVTLRQLAGYQQLTGGNMPDAPAALQTSLTGLFGKIRPDLFSPWTSVLNHGRGALHRITAELILDTGATPQLAGLRGVGDRRMRQLAFISYLADLDLEVTHHDGTSEITGQLGMDAVPPGLIIEFVPTDPGEVERAAEATIAEDGHFSLTLPSGEWIASVRIDDVVLLFPRVNL